MPAPDYNEYWKKRKKHGREKLFPDPDQIIAEAQEYIKTCKNNPIIVNELIKAGNRAGDVVKVERPRIPTQLGLCNYLGIVEKTFNNYKTKDSYKDFFLSFTYVSEMFRLNLLENSITGEANPMIVSRLLGLADKQEVQATNTNISVNVQDKNLADKLDQE